jgi:hypothetical protein
MARQRDITDIIGVRSEAAVRQPESPGRRSALGCHHELEPSETARSRVEMPEGSFEVAILGQIHIDVVER